MNMSNLREEFGQMCYNEGNIKQHRAVLDIPARCLSRHKEMLAMTSHDSRPSASDSQPETAEKLPLSPDEFIHWFYVRLVALSATAAFLMLLWTVLVSFTTDIAFLMFLGGFSMGMIVPVIALFRNDMNEISSFANFMRVYSVEILNELHQRRKYDGKARFTCVYLLQDMDVTGFYKIGKSTAPTDRIGHFDTMLPFETRVVHIIEAKDCNATETMLHRHFASKRVRGEWFRLSDADVAWITKLEAV